MSLFCFDFAGLGISIVVQWEGHGDHEMERYRDCGREGATERERERDQKQNPSTITKSSKNGTLTMVSSVWFRVQV